MFRVLEDYATYPASRWLPAIAWLVVFTLYSGMSIYLAGTTSHRVDPPLSAWLPVLGLGVVALFSLVVTARAWKDARAIAAQLAGSAQPAELIEPAQPPRSAQPTEPAEASRASRPIPEDDCRDDWPSTMPLRERDPETLPSGSSPLAEPLQQRLAGMLRALEAAGILGPDEVSLEAAIEAGDWAADLDDFGLDELLAVLKAVEVQRGARFRNLALFSTRGEVASRQIVEIVEDAVRLAGQFADLGSIQLEAADDEALDAVAPGDVGLENAIVHFDLDGHWQSIPFVMLADGFPLELIEGLAGALAPEVDERVFVEAWSGALVAISCIHRDRLSELDAALAWDGETFSRVDAMPVVADEPAHSAG